MTSLVPTDTHPIDEFYIENKPQNDLELCEFNMLSDEDVEHLVKKSATKSYILDPRLTSLLKEDVENFVPTLTDIIYTSLNCGVFPEKLKNAAVRPLLEKANLPLDDKNYRPVSHLSYLGKLIERAACDQILKFASRTGIIEKQPISIQSRPQHRISTVKVKSDL